MKHRPIINIPLWAVYLIGVVLLLGIPVVWQFSSNNLTSIATVAFEDKVQIAHESFFDTYNNYGSVADTLNGAFAGDLALTEDEWTTINTLLNLNDDFPAITSIDIADASLAKVQTLTLNENIILERDVELEEATEAAISAVQKSHSPISTPVLAPITSNQINFITVYPLWYQGEIKAYTIIKYDLHELLLDAYGPDYMLINSINLDVSQRFENKEQQALFSITTDASEKTITKSYIEDLNQLELIFDYSANSYFAIPEFRKLAPYIATAFISLFSIALFVTILLLNKSKSTAAQIAEEMSAEAKKSSTESAHRKKEVESMNQVLVNALEDKEELKNRAVNERNKFDAILNSIGDGVFVIDNTNTIMLVNRAVERLSGYPQADLINRPYDNLLIFESKKADERFETYLEQARANGKVEHLPPNFQLLRQDGSRIDVSDSIAPVKDKDGEIIGTVVIFRDVTKEREIDRMRSEFVSIASHQLRAPLTAIKWIIEMLEKVKEKLDDEERSYINDLNTSNEKMIGLVNDLLNVSRIESGRKFDLKITNANIIETVHNAIKTSQHLIDSKQIQLNLQLPEQFQINIDKDKISEVFKNLVNNAAKYTQENGEITIILEDTSEEVKFVIKDNGIGIPQSDQDKIFDKFHRAENAEKLEAEGTGLGLYIVKAIINKHGGEIKFSSEEGVGTEFEFTLPKNLQVTEEEILESSSFSSTNTEEPTAPAAQDATDNAPEVQ